MPSNGYINVELKDWLLFKSICAKTETEFSLPYIHDDLNKIEEDVREKQNHNHKWIKIINELTAKLEKETLNLNTLKGQEQKLKDTYRNKKKQKTTPANSNEGNSELVSLKAQIETSTEALQKIEIKIAKSTQNILSQIYKIKINGHKLANQLLEKRNWIEEKVQLFNSKAPNSLEIKNFIEKCKSVIDCASLFFAYPQFFGRAGFDLKKDGRTNFDSTRLKLPIANIFDTGLNILLLGEAGAGKSTSLQMYTINNTDNQQKLVVYIPLANALQHWHKSTLPFSPKEKLKDLDIGIASYLSLKGITITPDQFCLELSSKQTVILLDGLDEAIGQNPWLIDGIEHLAQKYKKFVQVIVTSRASGTYLDRLSFFAVTLLPFTEDQRNSFIDKWFDEETSENSETKERIKNHLNKNSSVSKVITNPLLTTTLCILANKDIKLPTTEIKLYDDRLNLYTGYYDRVKGIDRRIKSTPTNLELVARKLAFWLHEHQEREETKDVLIQQAITITSEGLSKQDAEIACLELIDPCNILIPMSDNGRFGFGHLQFQEHLVAKEIAMNRSIEILDLLNKQWWRGALIFFAHMNSDIYWLIHKVAEKSKLLLNEDILLKMLEVRPIKEQVSLRKMINTYSDSEENNTVKSFKISN